MNRKVNIDTVPCHNHKKLADFSSVLFSSIFVKAQVPQLYVRTDFTSVLYSFILVFLLTLSPAKHLDQRRQGQKENQDKTVQNACKVSSDI